MRVSGCLSIDAWRRDHASHGEHRGRHASREAPGQRWRSARGSWKVHRVDLRGQTAPWSDLGKGALGRRDMQPRGNRQAQRGGEGAAPSGGFASPPPVEGRRFCDERSVRTAGVRRAKGKSLVTAVLRGDNTVTAPVVVRSRRRPRGRLKGRTTPRDRYQASSVLSAVTSSPARSTRADRRDVIKTTVRWEQRSSPQARVWHPRDPPTRIGAELAGGRSALGGDCR